MCGGTERPLKKKGNQGGVIAVIIGSPERHVRSYGEAIFTVERSAKTQHKRGNDAYGHAAT